MNLPLVAFQRSCLLEGSMAFRTGHCLSAIQGGMMIRWIDQRFNPEIWDKHSHIRHLAVHGFKAEVIPSGWQGLLDPPSLGEDGCLWRWFTNAFKEIYGGFMNETHRWMCNRPVMCVDHVDDLSKSLLSQSHFVNAILNRGQNTLLV